MVNTEYLRENENIINSCVMQINKKSHDIEFGTCSLVLTFHAGRITKTEIQTAEATKIAYKSEKEGSSDND